MVFDTNEIYGRVDFTNAQHRYILSICYQLGWTRYNVKLKRMVADNARLGAWIKSHGKYKKPIMKHSSEELGCLITAMERMLANRVK